jgi:DNA-binding NtrC family response regulator
MTTSKSLIFFQSPLAKLRDCVTAGSAEEALDRLKEGHFELVISDISMPGMSGLEMIPLVKKISANTVIVMISGMQTAGKCDRRASSGRFRLPDETV